MSRVQVAQGTLEGKLCSTYSGRQFHSFEGIPYAKPPVGDLRFKAPQPPESWSGVRDATTPGDRCAQLNPLGKGVVEGSEDCLYLNIYTPKLPAEEIQKLPVLFFIHGGRIMLGYGDYYRPDYFIQHNVVFVTINYRLNILGFLCLDTPEVPGNAGLKDTIMALKWVNSNIKKFNGDPENITVFGESAGGAIGTSYLSSKMADGLFNKIICNSGVFLSDLYMINEDCMDKATRVASYFGVDTRDKKEIYDVLSKASVDDLLNAYTSASMDQAPDIRSLLLPVVEKEFPNVERFFEEYPIDSVQKKNFKKVPILTIANSDEGALFIQKDGDGNIIYLEDFTHFVPKYLNLAPKSRKSEEIVKRIREFYFEGDKLSKLGYIKLLNDSYFIRDNVWFAEAMSEHMDVFLCRFAYSGNMNTRVMRALGLKGAAHGDLIPYLFYRDSKLQAATERDVLIVDTLTQALCTFAKTGKPTMSTVNVDWQPYDAGRKLCLNVEDEITVERFPQFERMQFWFDLTKEKSKL